MATRNDNSLCDNLLASVVEAVAWVPQPWALSEGKCIPVLWLLGTFQLQMVVPLLRKTLLFSMLKQTPKESIVVRKMVEVLEHWKVLKPQP